MSKILDKRKSEHLHLALKALIKKEQRDPRFDYEALLSAHPSDEILKTSFLGKEVLAPLWISSVTGGNRAGALINKRLASVAGEFGLGMGLGSCRPLIENKKSFETFNVRPLLGEKLPLYANLGLAQVEELLEDGKTDIIFGLLESLGADGLIVHINPLQEWFQVEGDRFQRPPLETLEELLAVTKTKIIVKEVGQGFGPESLKALLKLPLAAVEFGAFGGTNFSKLELLRSGEKSHFYNPLAHVGHHAQGMVETLVKELPKCKAKKGPKEFIISGGIENFLDGHYLMLKLSKVARSCLYGQAGELLRHAQKSEKDLRLYVKSELEGLKVARAFLKLHNEN